MDSQQGTKLHSQTWVSLSQEATVLPEDLQREDLLLARPVGRADIRSGSHGSEKRTSQRAQPSGDKTIDDYSARTSDH